MDDAVLAGLTDAQRNWIAARGWQPKAGAVLLLPGADGGIAGTLLGTGSKDWPKETPLLPGALPAALPAGDYRFASEVPDPELATVAWLAGCYRFNRYKRENDVKPKRLVLPSGVDRVQASCACRGRSISAAT